MRHRYGVKPPRTHHELSEAMDLSRPLAEQHRVASVITELATAAQAFEANAKRRRKILDDMERALLRRSYLGLPVTADVLKGL